MLHFLLAIGISTAAADGLAGTSKNVHAYFANWALYHAGDYAYTADKLAPISQKLGNLNYAFMYFCPPPGTNPMPYWAQPPYGSCNDATAFQLMSVEPHDASFLSTINGFKASNPGLKLYLSVGGWNFPSAYFSAMAATSATRASFIASVVQWLQTYSADGIDIDWEYPCSAPRADPVEISCTDFQTVADAGGNCPADTTNSLALFKELSAALTPLGKLVSAASQAGKPQEVEENIAAIWPYVDHFNLMTYDYAVSDIPQAGAMSPNAPLFTPTRYPGAVQMSINDTVGNYLAAGVPASKIHVGIPLYGHTWYNPTLNATSWQGFGMPSYVQGSCCGPLAPTNGGKPGVGSSECGTYMYSETQAALSGGGAQTWREPQTQTMIAYFTAMGGDGSTTPGTWITYNDETSAAAIAAWAVQRGLGGVFVFDTSMDTMSGGSFTYGIMNAVAGALGAHSEMR